MDTTLSRPPAGQLLDGRYRVEAWLAHGGMATVYLGTDTRLDRSVALKIAHPELAGDEEFIRRFIGEARSVARLSSPHVVAVYDQGTDGQFLYLAMEYVPGRTLRELLRERGRLSPREALDIIEGVLAGLAAAHEAGIVHRDVKPENVLLTTGATVKVADFGLARAAAAAGRTKSGMIIGTAAYLAPEQVSSSTSDARTDVYAAGIMLFELLTGAQPHTGGTPLDVAYKHVNDPVPAPSSLVPGLPPALDALVALATSRNPDLRPADAGQFLHAITEVRRGLPISGLPGTTRAAGSLLGAPVPGGPPPGGAPADGPAAGGSPPGGWFSRSDAGHPYPPGDPLSSGDPLRPGEPLSSGGRHSAAGAAAADGRPAGGAHPADGQPGLPPWPGSHPGTQPWPQAHPGSQPWPQHQAGPQSWADGHPGPPPWAGIQHDAQAWSDPGLAHAGAPAGPAPDWPADDRDRPASGPPASLPPVQPPSGNPSAGPPVAGRALAVPGSGEPAVPFPWNSGQGGPTDFVPPARVSPRGQSAINHTLIVAPGSLVTDSRPSLGRFRPGSRPDYRRRGEPLLQRLLFSRRLVYLGGGLAAVLAAVLLIWWLTAGQYVTVPKVYGMSASVAQTELTNLGFTVKIGPSQHSNVPRGDVLRTQPASGTKASRGSTVVLIASLGPVEIQVPQVTGLPLDQAQAALTKAGLTPGQVTSASSPTIQAGIVISTNPVAGTEWPQPKPVGITVSAGPPLPNFVGQQLSDAQAAAQQGGYALNPVPDTKSNQPQGVITSQSPGAGTPITPNEVVTVHVSAGPQQVNIPDVTGMNVDDAVKELQQAGFNVAINQVTPGHKVISYSPTGQAPQGSTITLNIGFVLNLP